jgi:membrane protein implicated in regulation of membrane protease activity
MRLSTVINIIGLVAILVAVINLIAFREVWVLVVAMAVLAALAIYSVKEKQKLRQGSSQKS